MPDAPMYEYYDLTFRVERLVGGIPYHPNIIKNWQEARWPQGSKSVALAEIGITPETATEQTLEDLGTNAQSEDEVAAVWTGFAMMEHQEFGQIAAIESRLPKAMFKESANICKDMKRFFVGGKKIALRAKLAERLFVHPHWIPLLDAQGKPSEIENLERPIHVMTRQGPRTALKRTDYADNVVLDCWIKVLNDGMISEDILRGLLEHASENGLGTDRSQGAGTFEWELHKRDQ